MTKLPQTKGRDLGKILERNGFAVRKAKGSHVAYSHPDGRSTIVPIHSKPLGTGLLKAILKQAKLPESVLWSK